MHRKIILLIYLLFSAAVALAAEESKVTTELSVLALGPAQGEIDAFFKPWEKFEKEQKLLYGQNWLNGYSKVNEDTIKKTCKAKNPREEDVGVLYSLVVEPVIEWLFGAVKNSMKKRAEQYTASYKGTLSAQSFYEGELKLEKLAVGCFRLTRMRGDDITLDVIGQVSMMDEDDAIQIRPLRIFLGEKSTKKAVNNVLGVAVKMSVVSVFLDDGKPAKEKSIDQSLAAANFILPYKNEDGSLDAKSNKNQLKDIQKRKKLKKMPVRKQFAYMGFHSVKDKLQLKGWASYPPLPLPRWSTDASGKYSSPGQATITIDVAETGDSPNILRVVNDYWEKNKDTLSKLLKDAAEKAVGGDE